MSDRDVKGMSPRELDALVAIEVLGWHLADEGCSVRDDNGRIIVITMDKWESAFDLLMDCEEKNIPYHERYTTRTQAAWGIVDRWQKDGWNWQIAPVKPGGDIRVYVEGPPGTQGQGESTDAAMAISLAGLRAKGVDI